MSDRQSRLCPECKDEVVSPSGVARRDFIRLVSGGVAGAVAGASMLPTKKAEAAPDATPSATREAKPAESLVKELFSTLSDDQKKSVVFSYDHSDGKGNPTRLQTFNSAPLGKQISKEYTKPQQELILATLKSILSGEEAYERLTRHGKWDNSGSFEGNGVAIFGDPSSDKQFSWVFAGHHLTLRCDGNSQPNTAFGGPMYYGHSANGYADANVYKYQTQQVISVFDMLNEKQREKAIVVGNVGDGLAAMKLHPADKRPGVAYADLDASQKELVSSVMHTLLGPFRKEDGDEVMQLIKAQGGMDKIQLGFYKEKSENPNERWHSWRLEGPGFVWNYRVLPHVHCFVNITSQA